MRNKKADQEKKAIPENLIAEQDNARKLLNTARKTQSKADIDLANESVSSLNKKLEELGLKTQKLITLDSHGNPVVS